MYIAKIVILIDQYVTVRSRTLSFGTSLLNSFPSLFVSGKKSLDHTANNLLLPQDHKLF